MKVNLYFIASELRKHPKFSRYSIMKQDALVELLDSEMFAVSTVNYLEDEGIVRVQEFGDCLEANLVRHA